MKIDYLALGRRVKMLRKQQCLSQEELAELVGISIPHMSNIENGKTKFSVQVLVDLAGALKTTPNILLFGWEHGRLPETAFQGLDRLAEEGILKQAVTIERTVKTIKKILQLLEK